MSLALLSLLAADTLRRDPEAVFCPVADKDPVCGARLGCHRPRDVSRALHPLPEAYRPLRWLCLERLARAGRALVCAARPLPVPRQGTHPTPTGLEVAGAAGLSPLLRWLEGNDYACFACLRRQRPDRFWAVLYAYLHPPSGTTVHVVAAGTPGRLAVLRTMQTRPRLPARSAMPRDER